MMRNQWWLGAEISRLSAESIEQNNLEQLVPGGVQPDAEAGPATGGAGARLAGSCGRSYALKLMGLATAASSSAEARTTPRLRRSSAERAGNTDIFSAACVCTLQFQAVTWLSHSCT